MAITFDDLRNIDVGITGGHIFTTTSGGTVFSSDLRSSTTFDFFANSPSVNDAIYFSYMSYNPFRGTGCWHNLTINVGTARTNSGVGIWEYWNGSAWTTLTVTDNTNGFTNTGDNTVLFSIPTDWKERVLTGSSYTSNIYLVRYRLSDVTGIVEGGANTTTKVRVNSNTVVITGYSSSTPCGLLDIYNADIAGGWGIVTKDSPTSSDVSTRYLINANLEIGDYGTTPSYFKDTDKDIRFCGQIINTSQGFFTLGTTFSGTYLGNPTDGCYLNTRCPSTGRLYSISLGYSGSGTYYSNLYNSHIACPDYFVIATTSTGIHVLKDVHMRMETTSSGVNLVGNLYIDRLTINGTTDGFRLGNLRNTYINDVAVIQCTNGAYLGFASANTYCTVNNLSLKGVTNSFSFTTSGVSNWGVTLIDSSGFDITKVIRSTTTTYTDTWLKEVYTVNLQIVDKRNIAIVGANVWLTDRYGYRIKGITNSLGNVSLLPTVNTANIYTSPTPIGIVRSNPFVLEIMADGYQTYKSTFTVDEKKEMTITLLNDFTLSRHGMGEEFR